MVEVNYESAILFSPQHFVEKPITGGLLLTQHPPLTQARINQQSKRQRQVRLAGKIPDRLAHSVFSESEVVLGQARHNLALLVPHGGKDTDDPDFG